MKFNLHMRFMEEIKAVILRIIISNIEMRKSQKHFLEIYCIGASDVKIKLSTFSDKSSSEGVKLWIKILMEENVSVVAEKEMSRETNIIRFFWKNWTSKILIEGINSIIFFEQSVTERKPSIYTCLIGRNQACIYGERWFWIPRFYKISNTFCYYLYMRILIQWLN